MIKSLMRPISVDVRSFELSKEDFVGAQSFWESHLSSAEERYEKSRVLFWLSRVQINYQIKLSRISTYLN